MQSNLGPGKYFFPHNGALKRKVLLSSSDNVNDSSFFSFVILELGCCLASMSHFALVVDQLLQSIPICMSIVKGA